MNTSSARRLAPSEQAPAPTLPLDQTLVLLNRELVAGVDPAKQSRFVDNRWHLNAAIHEANAPASSLNFNRIPGPLRPTAKHYVWQLINTDCPAPQHRTKVSRVSISTIRTSWRYLVTFMVWLHRHQITELQQVTPDLLEKYLDEVSATGIPLRIKYGHVTNVRRIWSYRSVLPEPMRLPEPIPWGADNAQEILGKAVSDRVNLTRRISEQTMQALLAWSLRLVEDIADDIVSAYAEHQFLQSRSIEGRRSAGQVVRSPKGQLEQRAWEYIDRLRASGGTLPGKRAADGSLELDLEHLGRVFEYASSGLRRRTDIVRALRESGIPIADTAYLETPITGRIGNKPWRDLPIAHFEAPKLARHLATAATVIVAYLSGARPSEVLNLGRGCVERHGELWLMSGAYFKGAVGHDGNKAPAGAPRHDPWVVVEPVADAIAVIERLHDHPVLFPNRFDHKRNAGSTRVGTARTPSVLATDINAFVAWANALSNYHGIAGIPSDPHGGMNLSRFRRTLAWFIRRHPRGLVAGALQYGHVGTRIFQGYSGTYESGFPDEFAFEDFLARLAELGENKRRIDSGEHVSGPAADAYRQRISAAHKQFAGFVLTSSKQARDLVGNPLLQIFHGKGMTCVFDPKQAACQLRGQVDDPLTTPDIDDCRPRCPNIARTDRDVDEMRRRRDELAVIVADPLAPPIRHQREQHELDRLTTILENHR